MVACRLQLEIHSANFSFAVNFYPFSPSYGLHIRKMDIFGFNPKFSHVGGGLCWFMAAEWHQSELSP